MITLRGNKLINDFFVATNNITGIIYSEHQIDLLEHTIWAILARRVIQYSQSEIKRKRNKNVSPLCN